MLGFFLLIKQAIQKHLYGHLKVLFAMMPAREIGPILLPHSEGCLTMLFIINEPGCRHSFKSYYEPSPQTLTLCRYFIFCVRGLSGSSLPSLAHTAPRELAGDVPEYLACPPSHSEYRASLVASKHLQKMFV